MFQKDSQDSQREIGRRPLYVPSCRRQAAGKMSKFYPIVCFLKRKKKYKFVELLKSKKFQIENKVELLAALQTRQKRLKRIFSLFFSKKYFRFFIILLSQLQDFDNID